MHIMFENILFLLINNIPVKVNKYLFIMKILSRKNKNILKKDR